MPRKQPDIFYIYKTTCTVTGRYYIGMHSTANIDDGYMGSGKRLRASIRKYGKEYHVREILEYLPSRELLIQREKTMITEEMICNNECMNLMSGGTGGGGLALLSKEHLIEVGRIGGKIHAKKLAEDSEYRTNHINRATNFLMEAHKAGKCEKSKRFGGKKHSEKTILLMRESSRGKHEGVANSQYGTRWVTRDGINKKINKDDITTYLNENWKTGRVNVLKIK